MLRQRLILISIPVIGLIILITILGLWFLQGMLSRIQHLNDQAWVTVDRTNDFNANVHDCQKVMHEYLSHSDQVPAADALIATARNNLALIEQSSVVQDSPELTGPLRIIRDRLPGFLQGMQDFPKVSPEARHAEAARLVMDAEPIEAAIGDLMQIVREEARAEQGEIASSFRYGLVGLSIGFILILNVVILSFIRVLSTVQKPMDLLVRTARSVENQGDLPAVNLDRDDEFGQLADILNRLAKQVQATEESRLAVLGQVAMAMNHELNNAINIIDLQLKLLSRNADTPQMQAHIKQISETMKRMTRAVEALRQARRIVLTDYVGGTKMLDLERSAEAPSVEPTR